MTRHLARILAGALAAGACAAPPGPGAQDARAAATTTPATTPATTQAMTQATTPATTPRAEPPSGANGPVRIASPARKEGDGLVATAEVEAGGAEVGRAIVYRIGLRGPAAAGARADLDAFRDAAAKGDPFSFDLLGSTEPRRTAGDGDATWSMELVLSTLDAGLATPPPLAIAWRAGGAEFRLELPLPSVEVASLVGTDADPTDFREIAGEIEPAPDAGAWWLWPLGAFAATAVVAASLALWLRRDRAPVPADRRALAALASLAARGLPERREFGAFADELVRIVRAFTIDRFAIPADRRTTRELLAHLDGHAGIAAAEVERLRALLALADRVKFARTEPDPAECAAHLLDARRFVESCATDAPAGRATTAGVASDARAEDGGAR